MKNITWRLSCTFIGLQAKFPLRGCRDEGGNGCRFSQRTSCVFPATTRDRRSFFFLFTSVCYSEVNRLTWNRLSNVFVQYSALKTTLRNVVSRGKEATKRWVNFTFLLAVSLVHSGTRRNYNERMYDVQGLCTRKISLYRCAGKWQFTEICRLFWCDYLSCLSHHRIFNPGLQSLT